MPWFRRETRKPVGRRVGGREWTWSWEPEAAPGWALPRWIRPRWPRPGWVVGAAALGGVLAVAAVVAVTLALVLSGDGGGEPPAASNGSEGEETVPFEQLGDAVSVSLWGGSAPEDGVFANRCDAYVTAGRTAGGHALPDGDFLFQVTDYSGRVLLSTDEVRLRQVRVAGGLLRGVSGEGGHGVAGDGLAAAAAVQLCPFDESPDTRGEYRLWLTPVEDFRGDLQAVDSAARDFHGFVVSRSVVLVFEVMPEE